MIDAKAFDSKARIFDSAEKHGLAGFNALGGHRLFVFSEKIGRPREGGRLGEATLPGRLSERRIFQQNELLLYLTPRVSFCYQFETK